MNGTERLLDTKITEIARRLDEKIFGMDLRLSLKIEERFNQVDLKCFELRLHNIAEPLRTIQ